MTPTTAPRTTYRIQPVKIMLRTGWYETKRVTRYQLLRRHSNEPAFREIGLYRTMAAAKGQLTRRVPQWEQYVVSQS